MKRKKRRKLKRRSSSSSGRSSSAKEKFPSREQILSQLDGAPSWDLPHCPGCDKVPKEWAMMAVWVNRHNGNLDGTYTLCAACAELAQNPHTKYAVFGRCEDAMTLWAEARRAKGSEN